MNVYKVKVSKSHANQDQDRYAYQKGTRCIKCILGLSKRGQVKQWALLPWHLSGPHNGQGNCERAQL